jgi:ubiquinone biosynthesis monooxygenase Coq7
MRRMQAPLRWSDRLIAALDDGLRALGGASHAARPSPAERVADAAELSTEERRTSAALLRVNHAGELAAQGLYSGQALLARASQTRAQLRAAAREESDHLAWCAARLDELGGRPSLLAPFWYAGSFCIGLLAGSCGDELSLGFVAETERQVEAHLDDHLRRLPGADRKSNAILTRMAADEAHHGTMASLAGGTELPPPVRRCMAFGGEMLRRIAGLV